MRLLGQIAFAENVAAHRPTASSDFKDANSHERAVDGVIGDQSRWIGLGDDAWLTIELNGQQTVTTADLYTGYRQESPVASFRFQLRERNRWRDIDGGKVVDNDQLAIRVVFDRPVKTDGIRLLIDRAGEQDFARVREVRLWTDKPADLAALEQVGKSNHNPTFDMSTHLVFLNQTGFNLNWSKRFTAPLSPDGTTFTITPLTDDRVLFGGTIKGHIGDFSRFYPDDPYLQYVVRVEGGELKPGDSDPFFVAPMLLQRTTLEPALRMFVDARSVTGTHPGAYGCAPWRDSPFYAYSTPSLVNLYLTNPSFFDAQKVEIDFERDLKRVLAADFKFDDSASENAMEIVAKIRELGGLSGRPVPDMIQMIHWGVSWWFIDPISKDWAGTKNKLHAETVTIPAFFLYGFPTYQQYFTSSYYDMIRDWTFEQWAAAGLFDVQTKVGTFKGRYPPGWTILPNLMMYEVALREGRANSQRFLDAAVAQAEWIVANTDLRDPLNTKGQRMSEHKTISGLVTLLKHYPKQAPNGLEAYLRQWATIMVDRSDNMWDFRKYDDRHWSLPRQMPGMTGGGSSWNEPGNLAGFPFNAWSVASVLGNNDEDEALIRRLHQLAVSHFDNLFGRNPLGCHTAWRGPLDFVGVERGWPIKYRPVCAHLYKVRGTICSSAATEHYPFNPNGAFRHPEGWTAFNSALNMGLVGACHQDSELIVWEGQAVLSAPVFAAEAKVNIVDGANRQALTLTATDHTQTRFEAPLPKTIGEGSTLEYGYGYFSTVAK